MDSFFDAVPKLVSPPVLAGAGALLGASYLNKKLGVSRDVKNIVRGQRSLKALTAACIDSGKWNISYRWTDSVERRPEHVAFRTPGIEPEDKGRSWTYKEADDQINKIVKWLKEDVGVKFGDRVCLVFENSVQYLMILLAIQKLGAIHVPQNFNLRGTGFIHCVSIVTPVAIIFEDRMSHIFDTDVQSALNSKNVKMYCWDFTDGKARIDVDVVETVGEVWLERRYPGRVEGPSEEDGRKRSGPTDPAQILYTSGTTGLPKGTMHQHFALNRLALIFPIQFDIFDKDDTTICVLPMYHSQGLVSFYGTMCSGGTFIPVRKFSAKRFWPDVVRLNVTTFIYIGEVLRYLLASPPNPAEGQHKVKRIMGAGMRGDIFRGVRDRFGIERISEFYAASDGTAFTSFDWWGSEEGIGSVGHRGWIAKKMGLGPIIVKYDAINEELIRDKDGLCVECEQGEIGEVLGPYDPTQPGQPFYWANPEAIEKKIYRNVKTKGDMWWRSGDLFVQDNNGYYFFIDRIGDTFRWKAENVSTFEVGNAMMEFAPLQEANVYGVKVPGIEDGRAGMAMVVFKEEYQNADVDQLMKDLGKHTTSKLPRYACPIFIRLSNEVETTGTFKHKKTDLQKDGMDPKVVTKDRLFWMAPGSNEYVAFGPREFAGLAGISAKL